MSNNGTRGFEDNPTEQSTDRPQGQRRDDASSDDVALPEKDQAGAGKTPSRQTGDEAENIRVDELPDICGIVHDHLNDLVDGTLYFKAADIANRLGLTNEQAGVALSWLAKAPDADIDVEAWSKTRATTWRAQRVDDPVVVTDGGVPPCPFCGVRGQPSDDDELFRCDNDDCLTDRYQHLPNDVTAADIDRLELPGESTQTVAKHLVATIQPGEETYIKSRDIAANIDGMSKGQVGRTLAYLRDYDLPVEIEKWSNTDAGGTTWLLSREAEPVAAISGGDA